MASASADLRFGWPLPSEGLGPGVSACSRPVVSGGPYGDDHANLTGDDHDRLPRPQTLAAWWATALGVDGTQDYGEFVVVPATPLVLGFQRVPEPKTVKNRVHIDFASPDRPADVERLTGLGATVLGEHSMHGLTWTVLQDPEGNEFCLADEGAH